MKEQSLRNLLAREAHDLRHVAHGLANVHALLNETASNSDKSEKPAVPNILEQASHLIHRLEEAVDLLNFAASLDGSDYNSLRNKVGVFRYYLSQRVPDCEYIDCSDNQFGSLAGAVVASDVLDNQKWLFGRQQISKVTVFGDGLPDIIRIRFEKADDDEWPPADDILSSARRVGRFDANTGLPYRAGCFAVLATWRTAAWKTVDAHALDLTLHC